MQPRHQQPAQHSAAGGPTMRYSIEAEVHVRQAARWLELDPAPEAQRTAAVLFRVASRIRGGRGEVTVRW